MVLMTIFSVQAAAQETLWNYLAQHGIDVDLMDIAPGKGRFFIAGVRSVAIPWDTAEEQTIVPPMRRNLLLVLTATNGDQHLLWRREYTDLPDVYEVYSIAATTNEHLCVVYGNQPAEQTAINPFVVRLDNKGEPLWFKHIFPGGTEPGPDFLPTEHIANLDAIYMATSDNNSCVLAFVTRSVEGYDETYRLHVTRYDPNGAVAWHQSRQTDLYGKMLVVSSTPTSRHFLVQTNMSRDAALQAMILGQPFVPKITITSWDADGRLQQTVDLKNGFKNVWLHNVMATSADSLLIIGKKGRPWMAHVQRSGSTLNEFVGENKSPDNDAFDAIAPQGSDGYVVTHNGHISRFDSTLKQQSVWKIEDVTIKDFHNPRLITQLPNDLSVEKILPLSTQHYLLFYQYGSRLRAVDLGKPMTKIQD